jgi:hypothetical protein
MRIAIRRPVADPGLLGDSVEMLVVLLWIDLVGLKASNPNDAERSCPSFYRHKQVADQSAVPNKGDDARDCTYLVDIGELLNHAQLHVAVAASAELNVDF